MLRGRSPNRSLEQWLGALAVLNLALIALLFSNPSFSNASRPPRGIVNPILALEMARTINDVDAILSEAPSPDRETMRFKQYIDFSVIGAGTGFLLGWSVLLARTCKEARLLAIAGAVCGLVSAGFNVMENLAVLRVCDSPLSRTTVAMIDAVHWTSLAKYAAALTSMALLFSYFVVNSRLGTRLAGAIFLLAALFDLIGFADNNFFFYSGIAYAAGLVWVAAMYFRPGMR